MPVALVADGAIRAPVEAAVAADVSLCAFDDVGALRRRLAHLPRPAAIVVCDDGSSSLPALVEEVVEGFAEVPVVAVCPDDQRAAMRSMLSTGAAGVVLEQELGRALKPCLLAVMAGLTCLPAGGWRQLDPPVLSSREKQVLGLVVLGYMNSQIAKQLFLAESTVKSHLSSAFGKLGVRSRHEAAARILDPNEGLGVGILSLGGEPLQTLELQA